MHAQRGQTLPIWAFGSLTTLVLIAMALSFGSTLRWQMRAQNAADAAARGLLAVQTSQLNETIATLHAAAVEEYRIRFVINDLLQVIQGSGGCNSAKGASGPTACVTMYASLRQNYLDALQRYSSDVALLNRISYPSYTDQVSAINAALTLYQLNCGQPNGGDCAFSYSVVGLQPRADSYVEDVYADCCAWTVGGGTAVTPNRNLSPLEIEVVACANVQPLFASFFKFAQTPYQAIGRAAATSIMSTQEFLYVGSVVNPQTNQVFQPTEYPESAANTAVFSSSDPNYRIDYGGNPDNPNNSGNPATSDGHFGFQFNAQNQGLEPLTGWWQSMAIRPFMGQLSNGTNYTCK